MCCCCWWLNAGAIFCRCQAYPISFSVITWKKNVWEADGVAGVTCIHHRGGNAAISNNDMMLCLQQDQIRPSFFPRRLSFWPFGEKRLGNSAEIKFSSREVIWQFPLPQSVLTQPGAFYSPSCWSPWQMLGVQGKLMLKLYNSLNGKSHTKWAAPNISPLNVCVCVSVCVCVRGGKQHAAFSRRLQLLNTSKFHLFCQVIGLWLWRK